MMDVVAASGYAWVEYFAVRDAIKGIMKDFSVISLADVKTIIDKRPTVKDVRSLEHKES